MKYIRLLLFVLVLMPFSVRAQSNDFMVAAQLLSAAKNADIQQVQILINSGANVNYVDSTGLSLVCTALMNNDMRAAQILQMYGADASKCDQQIKSYNNRTKPKGSGGLFSGLSSTHKLTLAAAGAAVVVGGLLLLTDVFDAGNGNDGGSSGGNRPTGNGSGNGTTSAADAKIELAYGPAMPNATSEAANYTANLNYYSSVIKSTQEGVSDITLLKDNFDLMNSGGQNYLLMMHGYSPLARGYMGMRTLRFPSAGAPIEKLGTYESDAAQSVLGGRPTNVALVTANGINAALKPVGELSAEKNSLDDTLLVWTSIANPSTGALATANRNSLSSKYFNNIINNSESGTAFTDLYTTEDNLILSTMDLGGFGTAVQNPFALADDDILAKIVGGRDSGYASADYFGFMPNGQMMILRTGNGMAMKDVTDEPTGITDDMRSGTISSIATGGALDLFGKTLTLTVDGNTFTATDGTDTYTGYISVNGMMYIDSKIAGILSYKISDDNNLTLAQKADVADYYNYKALLNASLFRTDGQTNGRSHPDVIANASIIAPLYSTDTKTIESVLAAGTTQAQYQTALLSFINDYYNRDTQDGVVVDTGDDATRTDDLPSSDAAKFFSNVGSLVSPLVVFSTGAFETDANYTNRVLSATFENAAPLAYSNLEHLFMSVVAVGQIGTGTSQATSIAGYTPKNKYTLSRWSDTNGTDTTDDDVFYQSRVCGVAGTGTSDIDPWCFAATGVNAQMATSAAAGAAGSIKSAFDYLSNSQVFTLLALTADGPYLATVDGGNITKDGLVDYLQARFEMPNEYNAKWTQQGQDYLDVFKEVFGYGLINLERATTPGTKVYFYDGGNKIVSANGDAYWRAATQTAFRASSAFRPRAATISAPFYDILESVDGEMRMPRVWKNEFALSSDGGRGLYMGDVLGDLKTYDAPDEHMQIGNLGFSLMRSQRAYNDNLNGLDSLSFDYSRGAWNFAAGYQHYLTDGVSRFTGAANPILSMASNAITSDAEYGAGRWSFGGRVFSGSITDEGLLENDPTVTSQFMPAKLGTIQGAQSHVGWRSDMLGFTASAGVAYESDTILGAQTGGLLNLGGGNTTYFDTVMRIAPMDKLALTLRGTFARTTSDVTGDFVLGMSDVSSNAFAAEMDFGNFSFGVMRPLAVTRGNLQYAHADYDVIETAAGKFDLDVRDMHIANLNLRPENRELRFTGTWRHKFGEFTDGALGLIYRVHPDNTDDFGNESIFMMKMTHRLGI
ncbi:MAG: ankyrin repeat domain-containing protein [Muribaculaceae bacterium]|nr:ankyrin repeat domain-containing protein [Muribaculaceae bacterium]